MSSGSQAELTFRPELADAAHVFRSCERLLAGSEVRSAHQLVLGRANDVPTLAGVIGQHVPGQRMVALADAKSV